MNLGTEPHEQNRERTESQEQNRERLNGQNRVETNKIRTRGKGEGFVIWIGERSVDLGLGF